ncbi:MAG: hypothetical protein ACTHLB_00280 [Parafilimonas sp.]
MLKNKGVYIVLAIILLAMIYPFADRLLDIIYMSKDHAYAITCQISFMPGGKIGGPKTKYVFNLKGKNYAGLTSLPLKDDGTNYFIKFYPGNPNRNVATNIMADSSDIQNLPVNGYKNLPRGLKF